MDAASFKQQFLPCHAKLYRVAFRLMGNVQDAEDMVQEAYLKLWNKRDELSDRTKTADCPKSLSFRQTATSPAR